MSLPASAPNLDQLQQWMQSVITHPEGIVTGIGSPQARQQIDISADDVERVILPGPAQSSIERLAVYGNAYYTRLLGVLGDLFPALAHALGEEAFNAFAFGYLNRYPSRSYTLGRLADHFVGYLEQTRPQPEAEPSADTPSGNWPDFVIDLARLEWTIDDVFDGPGVEGEALLDPAQLAAIEADRWPEVRLVPVVCLRLLSFAYPVNDYYTAFRRGMATTLPPPRATFAALLRRDYVVRRYDLSADQFELLTALVDGQLLGEAIARCARRCQDVDRMAGELQIWFRQWAARGFFQRVDISMDC